MKAYSLMILFLGWFHVIAYSQQKTLIRKFEYKTMNQMTGDSVSFDLYYKIDSTDKLVYNGKIFYSFVFSLDSLDKAGYIRFDSASKCILFISKFYKEGARCEGSQKIQRLFCFKKSVQNLCYAGFLGNVTLESSVLFDKNNKKKYLINVRYPFLKKSDSVYIRKIVFENYIYPKSVFLEDTILDRLAEVNAH
jgi:hypothetical protein